MASEISLFCFDPLLIFNQFISIPALLLLFFFCKKFPLMSLINKHLSYFLSLLYIVIFFRAVSYSEKLSFWYVRKPWVVMPAITGYIPIPICWFEKCAGTDFLLFYHHFQIQEISCFSTCLLCKGNILLFNFSINPLS